MKSITSRIRARRSNAFTLIELLTVIAIMAILAAIIFPVFGAVRENARRASCMTNMKNISSALKQYELDNRKYPDFLFAPAIKQFSGGSEANLAGCAAINNKLVIAQSGEAACTPEQASGSGKLGGDYVDGDGVVIASGGLYPEYVKSLSTFSCPNNTDFLATGDKAFNEKAPGSKEYPVTGGTGTTVPERYDAYTLDKNNVESFNDVVAIPLYKFDSYDSNPFIVKNSNGEAQPRQDDTQWVARYSRQWMDVVNDPSNISDPTDRSLYQNQLLWRNPGDDSVVTMCTYHATSGKVVVLYLSGSAKVLDLRTLRERAATGVAGRDFDTFRMHE